MGWNDYLLIHQDAAVAFTSNQHPTGIDKNTNHHEILLGYRKRTNNKTSGNKTNPISVRVFMLIISTVENFIV